MLRYNVFNSRTCLAQQNPKYMLSTANGKEMGVGVRQQHPFIQITRET